APVAPPRGAGCGSSTAPRPRPTSARCRPRPRPARCSRSPRSFNCLEAPGSFVTPVAEYFHDPTQGPRASISAFPATLVRHYAAPHRTSAQVLTATIAGGMYGDLGEEAAGAAICRQLQRAAYLGTLLAAAALGKRRVALTLIGGGVFANPIRTIWDAILWASDQDVPFLHTELSIVVNGRNLGAELPPTELHAEEDARGGHLVTFDRSGAQLTGNTQS